MWNIGSFSDTEYHPCCYGGAAWIDLMCIQHCAINTSQNYEHIFLADWLFCFFQAWLLSSSLSLSSSSVLSVWNIWIFLPFKMWLCRLIWMQRKEKRRKTKLYLWTTHNNNGTALRPNVFLQIVLKVQRMLCFFHSRSISLSVCLAHKTLNGNKWTRLRCVNHDMSRRTHCRCHFQLFASIIV